MKHLLLAGTLALSALTQITPYSDGAPWSYQPAQAPAYYLHIDALTSVAGKDFRIAITRTPRVVRFYSTSVRRYLTQLRSASV